MFLLYFYVRRLRSIEESLQFFPGKSSTHSPSFFFISRVGTNRKVFTIITYVKPWSVEKLETSTLALISEDSLSLESLDYLLLSSGFSFQWQAAKKKQEESLFPPLSFSLSLTLTLTHQLSLKRLLYLRTYRICSSRPNCNFLVVPKALAPCFSNSWHTGGKIYDLHSPLNVRSLSLFFHLDIYYWE